MTIKAGHKNLCEIRNSVHPKCVVCSPANIRGLHMNYDVDGDSGVRATFECDYTFEGYPGMVHGGVLSSILDGAMGNCMFAHGLATVTVELTTKFRHPVMIGQQALVSARIIRHSHPLYLLEAEIVQDGTVKATAKGKFYNQQQLIDMD